MFDTLVVIALAMAIVLVASWFTLAHRAAGAITGGAASMPQAELRLYSEQPEPAASDEWRHDVLNDLTRVQDRLDWLESFGHTQRRLVILGNDRFVVCWR